MDMNTIRRSSVRKTSAAFQRRLKPEPEPTLKKFAKIILLSTLEEKMMKIPARFVRLGPKLSDIVTIETPKGFKCRVRIKRVGDEVWFENGWNEFAETHSLSEGHFLFFHYQGNSRFRVIIFDVSASEIEYPSDDVMEVVNDDDEGFAAFVNTTDNYSSGVIDLDPRVNIKSEEVALIEID